MSTVRCPNCGGRLAMAVESAGQVVPCPECGKPLRLPLVSGPAPEPDARVVQAEADEPRPADPSHESPWGEEGSPFGEIAPMALRKEDMARRRASRRKAWLVSWMLMGGAAGAVLGATAGASMVTAPGHFLDILPAVALALPVGALVGAGLGVLAGFRLGVIGERLEFLGIIRRSYLFDYLGHIVLAIGILTSVLVAGAIAAMEAGRYSAVARQVAPAGGRVHDEPVDWSLVVALGGAAGGAVVGVVVMFGVVNMVRAGLPGHESRGTRG